MYDFEMVTSLLNTAVEVFSHVLVSNSSSRENIVLSHVAPVKCSSFNTRPSQLPEFHHFNEEVQTEFQN